MSKQKPSNKTVAPHFALYANPKTGLASVTKDGHTMFNEDIVSSLNRKSYLEAKVIEQNDKIIKLKSDINVMVAKSAPKHLPGYQEQGIKQMAYNEENDALKVQVAELDNGLSESIVMLNNIHKNTGSLGSKSLADKLNNLRSII